MSRWSSCWLGALTVMMVLFVCSAAYGSDISLTLNTVAHDDLVSVELVNVGTGIATDIAGSLEIDGVYYEFDPVPRLAPNARVVLQQRIRIPNRSGSHPLVVRFTYKNDGALAGVVAAAYYNARSEKILDVPCPTASLFLRDALTWRLPQHGYNVSVAFPPTVQVVGPTEMPQSAAPDPKFVDFQLEYAPSILRANATVYSIFEHIDSDGLKASKICPTNLTLYRNNSVYSQFPDAVFAIMAVVGLVAGLAVWRPTLAAGGWRVSISRAAFSLGTVSSLLLFSRWAGFLGSWLLNIGLAEPLPLDGYLRPGLTGVAEGLLFQGSDYEGFFRYVADPLFLYFLFGNVFVVHYLIRPDPAREKYSLLMSAIVNGFRKFAGCSSLGDGADGARRRGVRVALLALAVKAYYVPMLTSWTATNLSRYLTQPILQPAEMNPLNPIAVTAAIVNVLIFIDVSVFAVGYLFELPQLKNEIRSVEPTVFGWFICLICYPPFFHLSQAIVERPLQELWPAKQGVGGMVWVHVINVVLWFIYTWASVALGVRASNLTNRGIVDRGPYRFIRHPAYVSKVGVWVLSSWTIGTLSPLYALYLLIVYSLRAWTEERHLGLDPEYGEYCKRVRWRVVPGIF